MFATKTLASLLDEQTSVLRTQLSAVYDGLADAVHDSRVATRRIRELLALVPVIPGRDGEKDVASGYQRIGRALGKVRGKETAARFLGEGASVVLVDIDQKSLDTTAKELGSGDRVLTARADVSNHHPPT